MTKEDNSVEEAVREAINKFHFEKEHFYIKHEVLVTRTNTRIEKED